MSNIREFNFEDAKDILAIRMGFVNWEQFENSPHIKNTDSASLKTRAEAIYKEGIELTKKASKTSVFDVFRILSHNAASKRLYAKKPYTELTICGGDVKCIVHELTGLELFKAAELSGSNMGAYVYYLLIELVSFNGRYLESTNELHKYSGADILLIMEHINSQMIKP